MKGFKFNRARLINTFQIMTFHNIDLQSQFYLLHIKIMMIISSAAPINHFTSIELMEICWFASAENSARICPQAGSAWSFWKLFSEKRQSCMPVKVLVTSKICVYKPVNTPFRTALNFAQYSSVLTGFEQLSSSRLLCCHTWAPFCPTPPAPR